MPVVTRSAVVSSVLGVWMGASAQIAGAATPPVNTCDSITLAREGVGVAYKGAVRNDDYGVRIVIPGGLTAWGGVAPEAPFHGFVIFPPDRPQSCMGFEIQLQVDPGHEALEQGHYASKAVAVGNRRGWKEARSGAVSGVAFTNVTISFSVSRRREVYDGSMWLVTPTEDLGRNMLIFRRFVSQIRFDGEPTH